MDVTIRRKNTVQAPPTTLSAAFFIYFPGNFLVPISRPGNPCKQILSTIVLLYTLIRAHVSKNKSCVLSTIVLLYKLKPAHVCHNWCSDCWVGPCNVQMEPPQYVTSFMDDPQGHRLGSHRTRRLRRGHCTFGTQQKEDIQVQTKNLS